MKKIIFLILIFQVAGWSYGQQNYGTHEYATTLYNLFALNYKSYSYPQEKLPGISIQDVKCTTNKEAAVVYFVYEVNSEFKKYDASHTTPNNKLMEFYIVYDYNYRIFYASKGKHINEIPKIKLDDGCSISKVTFKNYFIDENGKLDNKQLKKSAFNMENDNGLLTMQIEDNSLKDSSLLEIHIKVRSKNFLKLQPSISNIASYEKHLVVSFPAIFNYTLSAESKVAFSSHSTSSFELLNFLHTSSIRNGNIEKYQGKSQIYSWDNNTTGTADFKPEFELNGIKFISNIDIGITENEILNLD